MLVPTSNFRAKLIPASFVGLAVLVALFLRIAAANGELWLDEIWSLELAQQVGSPLDLVTKLKHDNNHLLNTAYLAAVGPDHPWLVYRLPSIIAGSFAVVLGGMIAGRRGQIESLTAMTLLSTSYVMIHYSSEARGYALLMLFVLAGTESLLRVVERGRWRWIALFWLCCVAGFLSHPLFIQFWLPAAVWSLLEMEGRIGWQSVRRAAILHCVPVGFVALLYGIFWRHIELGGGPKYSMIQKLVEVASLTIGGTFGGLTVYIFAFISVLAIGTGLWCLRDSSESIRAVEGENSNRPAARLDTLFTFVIISPLLQALATRPPFLFVRYFLVAMLFGLLALSMSLGWLYRRNRFGSLLHASCLLAFMACNTWHTVRLVHSGRGQYQLALQAMSTATEEQTVTISSDHNFGVRKLVEFYGPRVSPSRQFTYFDGQSWPPEGPRWLVLHHEADVGTPPAEKMLSIDGHRFQLVQVTHCAPLSGWQWSCYRRVP